MLVLGVMSEALESQTWWKEVRAAIDEHGLYRINPGYSNPKQTGKFWVKNDIVSLSDWALDAHGHTFLKDLGVVAFDSVDNKFKDSMEGDILWGEVRELIDDIQFSDKDTKISAGKAKGCIRRFVEVFELGTGLIVNLQQGQAFARVTSECVFDPNHEVAVIEDDHVFQREVEFLREDNGEVITFDTDSLPSGLCPAQNSIVEADSRWLLEVTRGVQFLSHE